MATEVSPPQMDTMHMKLNNRGAMLNPQVTRPHIKKKDDKIKMDPLRALEPARKKLSSVESQRIMAVLEDTIKRIDLLTMIPQIIENVDRFSVILGIDLVNLLKEHAIMRESFDEISQKLDSIRGTDRVESADPFEYEEDFYTKPKSQTSKGSIDRKSSAGSARSRATSQASVNSQLDSLSQAQQFLAEQINFSVRNILRAFANNPSAIVSVKNEFSQQGKTVKSLLGGLSKLKDIMMERLLTTPVEAHERVEYLIQVTQRERTNSGIIEKLEAELNVAIADKDEEIKKRNDVIRRLQSDLHQIEKFSEEHIRRTKSEAEKQESSDSKNSDGKKSKLTGDMNQLQTHLQNLIAEHREKESELRKKKYKIETEVENWIQKYDQDMGERQDEYEEIDAVYTEEKKQLHELEERFKTLEKEYNQIMEERRIAQEKREEAERELQKMVLAATCVQAFWRSYKVRKGLKGKKKKGGKGKGGKKKK